VAGGKVIRSLVLHLRRGAAADFLGVTATWVKPAAGGNGQRRGDVVPEDGRLTPSFAIYSGDGCYQGFGIGVQALREQCRCRGALNNGSQVHDADPITDMAQHGKIVGDDQQGKVVGCLHVLQQINDLGLDGDVQ